MIRQAIHGSAVFPTCRMHRFFVATKQNDMKRFLEKYWPIVLAYLWNICLTILFLIFSSCSRVQYVPVEEQSDSTMNENILANSNRIDSLFAFFRESENRTAEKLSELVVNSNTVYWSAPDSSGNQYKEKENTTVINNTERDFSSLERLTEVHYKQLSARIDSLYAEIRKQGNVKKVSAPKLTRWQQWKQDVGGWSTAIIIITLIIVVGMRVYKLIK